MNTQERVKLALPIAEMFVRYSIRIKQIDASFPKPPRNVFCSTEEATSFDDDYEAYKKAKRELEVESADLKLLIVAMNRWGEREGNPTLSELLEGHRDQQSIKVVVTVDQLNYLVEETDGALVYKTT